MPCGSGILTDRFSGVARCVDSSHLMLRKIFAVAAMAASIAVYAEHFKVIIPLSDDEEGAMAYLRNDDTGEYIDSILVADHVAVFEGETDETALVSPMIGGMRLSSFILEPGTISVSASDGMAFGTMLNDQMRAVKNQISALGDAFRAADDAGKEQIFDRYTAFLDSTMQANADNALGYFAFMNGDVATMSASEIRQVIAAYPMFEGYQRVRSMLEKAERREATQPGNKFLDFEITYEGRTYKLSDYVGKGHYTLVDFWASWCGPCIRQTAVLKDIYAKYHDSGLEVLGVAVWDEPEDTMRAIEQHELPWECILDARTIPTDIYGISGIPCIILFGPDGTILSRDKQNDELRADVDAAMSATSL